MPHLEAKNLLPSQASEAMEAGPCAVLLNVAIAACHSNNAIMKRVAILSLAALSLFPASARAMEAPEAVVKTQMAALRAGDWNGFATAMHPAALQEFQSSFMTMLRAAPAGGKRDEMLSGLFGGKSLEDLKALNPTAFFANFMESLSKLNPIIKEGLAGADAEMIGHVDEGADTTHVVMRMTIKMGQMQVTKMEVTSLQRDGDEWKALLKGDMQTMIAGMVKMLTGK